MTERGQPMDVALACPFVAFDDERDERGDQPDARHRCYAESPPAPLSREHQEHFCLSPGFAGCPIFRAWARREAARVQRTQQPEDPAIRLRDIPAAREASAAPGAPVWPPVGQEAQPPAWSGREEPDERPFPGHAYTEPVDREPGTATPTAPLSPQQPGFARPDPTPARAGEPPRFGEPLPPDARDARQPGRDVPDLPPRPVHQGQWSQPPPWLHGPADTEPGRTDDERLDQLVARRGSASPGAPPSGTIADMGGRPAEPPSFLTRPPDRQPGAGLAGSIADESAAAALASRLAALGMADPASRTVQPQAGQAPAAAPPAATAIPPLSPQAPASAPPASAPASAPVRRIAAPEDDIIGARVVREPGSSGGLSRILRWGRPQEAGDPRAAAAGGSGKGRDRRGPEPSWERPRRYEAYPTIRSRVGMPRIPRVAIGAVALALAAAFLFFVVPTLFVGDDGAGPGSSAAPSGAASSASAAPSRTPTRSAAPTPRVYVVRAGDTLSTIAVRFGLTVDQILAVNPDITNPNQIAVGDRIVIPTTPAPSPSDEESPEPSASG